MELLYNQEEVWELDRQAARQEARQEALAEGEQNGLLRALRSLIQTTGFSIEQAMASLQITEAERPAYRALLKDL